MDAIHLSANVKVAHTSNEVAERRLIFQWFCKMTLNQNCLLALTFWSMKVGTTDQLMHNCLLKFVIDQKVLHLSNHFRPTLRQDAFVLFSHRHLRVINASFIYNIYRWKRCYFTFKRLLPTKYLQNDVWVFVLLSWTLELMLCSFKFFFPLQGNVRCKSTKRNGSCFIRPRSNQSESTSRFPSRFFSFCSNSSISLWDCSASSDSSTSLSESRLTASFRAACGADLGWETIFSFWSKKKIWQAWVSPLILKHMYHMHRKVQFDGWCFDDRWTISLLSVSMPWFLIPWIFGVDLCPLLCVGRILASPWASQLSVPRLLQTKISLFLKRSKLKSVARRFAFPTSKTLNWQVVSDICSAFWNFQIGRSTCV